MREAFALLDIRRLYTVLIALAIGAAGFGVAVTAASSTYYSEDFSTDPLASEWDVLSGSWAVESGVLSVQSPASSEAWAYEKVAAFERPFRVEFDLSFQAEPSDEVGKHGGVMLSTSRDPRGVTSGYEIDWIDRAADRGYRFVRFDGGSVHSIARFGSISDPVVDQFNRWAIEFGPTTIRLLIDGQEIGNVEDAAYQGPLWLGFWAWENHQHIHFDNISVAPIGTPGAPENLSLARGPDIGDVHLRWDPPSFTGEGPITGYEIHRAPLGGQEALVATIENTSFVDSGLPCSTTFVYRVRAVNSAGVGEFTEEMTTPPEPRLHLLCLLSAHPNFYWGEVPLDNSAGAPIVPPRSLEQIDSKEAEGQYPLYFQLLPQRIECCADVSYDGNTLQSDDSEWTLRPVMVLRSVLPDEAHGFLEEVEDIGTLRASFEGFRYHDRPFLDPFLGNTSAMLADLKVDLAIDSERLGRLEAEGSAGGKLYLDTATGMLRHSALDTLIVQVAVPGPGIGFNRSYSEGVEWTPLGYKLRVGFDAAVEAALNTTVTGALGGKVETGSIQPRLFLGGLGGEFNGKLDMAGRVDVVVGGSVRAHSEGALALRTELLQPLGVGLSPGEVMRSTYSGIAYHSVPHTAFSAIVDPVEIQWGEVIACAHFRWFDVCDGLTLPPFHWEGRAVTFGSGSVTAPPLSVSLAQPTSGSGSSTLAAVSSTLDAGASVLVLTPAQQDLHLVLEAAPGTSADLTVTRAIGAYAPNGTYEVREWNVTLPQVTVGPEGESRLFIDSLEIQTRIQDLTRSGVSYDEAVHVVNRRIDANGDGSADLVAGAVPHDGRLKTQTQLLVPAPEIRVGEPVSVSVKVEQGVDRVPVSNGSVAIAVSGEVLATVDVDDMGTAEATFSLPSGLALGLVEIEAAFLGNSTLAGSNAVAYRMLVDGPPLLEFEGLDGFEVLQVPEDRNLAFNLSAGNATDALVETIEMRINDGPWIRLGSLQPQVNLSAIGVDVADGLHQIDARIQDAAGNVGLARIAIALDTGAPELVQELERDVLAPGETARVRWDANEPVAARLRISPIGEGPVRVVDSGVFARSGELETGPLRSGLYVIEVEYTDTASREPEDVLLKRPFVVAVQELPMG